MTVEIISETACVDESLTNLVSSIAGTIPGSRGFGLTGDATSLPPERALNTLYAELDEKVDEYIPEISIESIQMESAMDGGMLLRITVEESS